jgi:hypothetical protein
MGVYYNKADFITYGKPSLFLDFANKKSLVDRISGNNLITFTRTSTGTYVGADGLIKSAATNEPRFDHNPLTGECLGLLIEEGKTNFATTSETFTQRTLRSSSLVTTSITAPNGTASTVKLTESISTTRFREIDVAGGAAVGTGIVTHSIFVKKAERDVIFIGNYSTTPSVWIGYNLSTESFFTVDGFTPPVIYNYQKYLNGWYRIWYTFDLTVNNDSRFDVVTGIDEEFTSYTGDGTSGIYVWGQQIEKGDYPSSYIPTPSTSVVTRTLDNASITGTNFSSWYNTTEGNVFCSARLLNVNPISSNQILWSIGDSATSDKSIYLSNNTSTDYIEASIVDDGVNQISMNGPIITSGSLNKISLSYKLNDSAASFNSSTPTTDTSCTLPTVNSLKIGNASWGTANPINGTIAILSYYPFRFTNINLQNITR